MDEMPGADSRARAVAARKSRRGGRGGTRNGGSRERILKVALREFATKGLSGARVDTIAAKAKTSKHMVYYHFRSKEELYKAVLEQAYAGIRASEQAIDVDHMEPIDALRAIIRQSFDYHADNEMFVRLVMNENIHHARYITERQIQGNKPIIETLSRILERGKRNGYLRADIDPRELHLTISALGFHFVSNKYTFAKIFELDMSSQAARERRREIVIDTILRWCAANPVSIDGAQA